MLVSNRRAWGVVLPDTCGFGIGPLDCPHWGIKGRGENLFFMAKNSNGEFYLCFWIIYRNVIYQVGFLPIVHNSSN